jgi:UDP-glucose 4-epimerase
LGDLLKIVVLGGAGFVGKVLVEKIAALGMASDVVIVDRDLDRLNKFSGQFQTECFDVSNVSQLKNLFETHEFTHVFHLVANSDIKAGATSPAADFNDTFKSSVALAEVLRFHPINTLFFSSSSAVYGEIDETLDSNLSIIRCPVSSYGWAKLGSEMLLHESSRSNDFRFVNMRFPNVVGGEPTHGLLFDMKSKLDTEDEYLEVLGDGSQNKPYIHVEELCSIIIRLVLETETFRGDCNIGPKDTITVKQIIQIILEISQLLPKVAWGTDPFGWPGDVRQYSYSGNLPKECRDLVISSSENAIRTSVRELWRL